MSKIKRDPSSEREKQAVKGAYVVFRLSKAKYISEKVVVNPAYGQHLALSYVCESGVPILYHES